jgi:DNA repair exonuclease SbcCD ATPase subunit
MAKNKNKRRGRDDEDWIESGNESDYGNANQLRETNGAGHGNRGETSSGPNNLPRSAAINQDQSSSKLQPYTQTVRETTRAIAAAQITMQNLNDMYLKHVDEIENVPNVYQQLSKLKKECVHKNEKINRQKHTIIELKTESREQEAEFAERRAKLEKDEGEIERLKQDQLKKAAKAEKSMDLLKLEIRHKLEEEFKDRKNEQEKQHRARMKQLEDQMSSLKSEWDGKMKQLDAENMKLSNDLGATEARIRELVDQLKTAKDDLDDAKTAKTVYKKEKESLEVELRAVQNEFGLKTQTTDF